MPEEPSAARRGTRVRRLPTPLTALIGREAEIAAVAELLTSRRLVTLVGPPGIGKTRLAVAVAADLADGFADGAVFVSLGDAESAERVVATIARALEITEVPDAPLIDTVASELSTQHLLLVLDNLEQVLDAAPLIGELATVASGVRFVCTSRERLRISGEQVYAVPPLRLPDLGLLRFHDRSTALLLEATSPAVALFVERASMVAPDFVLDEDTAPPVARLCHRLDGLPLALELAAARAAAFSPAELLADLNQRLDMPSAGPRDAPARHRTLQAAIEWSFALLHADEQTMLTTLSVFAGGALLEAVGAVCAPDQDDSWVAQRLAALVEKNMARAWPDPEGRTRYVLLQTIRFFAAELLTASGDADAVRARHAEYFAAFTQRAEPELVGATQDVWIGRVDREYHNLLVAMSWALAHDQVEKAGQIAADLRRYWMRGTDIGSGRRWYARILARPELLPAGLRVRLFLAAAHLACRQSELDVARELAQRGLDEANRMGDRLATGRALNVLASVADDAGDHETAQVQYGQCIELFREFGALREAAMALVNLGDLAFRRGDLEAAAAQNLEGLELLRGLGDSGSVMTCLYNVAEVRIWQGDAAAARPLLIQALAMSRDHGDKFVEAAAVDGLGRLAGLAGQPAEERRLCADALELRRETGEHERIADSLRTFAGLAIGEAPAFAVRLLGAAAALRERFGLGLPVLWQASLDGYLGRLHEALDDTAFDAAWASGRAAPIEVTIAQTLAWAREAPARSARE